MTGKANSAHSILLSHTLTNSRVNYKCNVTEVKSGEKKVVDKDVLARFTSTVTRLLPDTTYRVDCVAYHSDGVEYCLEANTTVTTRELCTVKVTVCMYVVRLGLVLYFACSPWKWVITNLYPFAMAAGQTLRYNYIYFY